MVEVKEMPYHEKYEGILDLIDLLKGFAPRFVGQELGQEKADELLKRWDQESVPIPHEASFSEKYDMAHSNFLKNWISALNFVVEHPQVNPDRYIQVAVEAWDHKYSSSAFWLKIYKGISSKEAAFEALTKRLSYSLQIFSPFAVSEMNNNRMVLTANPCKVRAVRGCDDFCLAACQNIIPVWLNKQFSVKMSHRRDGSNCAVTFEPF